MKHNRDDNSYSLTPEDRGKIRCPFCGSDKVSITTADYGFGHGTEFGCFAYCGNSDARRFAVKGAAAQAISDASRALSKANAAKYGKDF